MKRKLKLVSLIFLLLGSLCAILFWCGVVYQHKLIQDIGAISSVLFYIIWFIIDTIEVSLK